MNNKVPLVSVVIPTFNMAKILRHTLHSVIFQNFSNYEVWIIGDGCTDESESVVASFEEPRFRWINQPDNSGSPSFPRNVALEHARGKYIAYLGHDDLCFHGI